MKNKKKGPKFGPGVRGAQPPGNWMELVKKIKVFLSIRDQSGTIREASRGIKEASKPCLDPKITKITDFKKSATPMVLTTKGIHF